MKAKRIFDLWNFFKERLLLLMPKLAPIKRKDLIYYLRQLGFDGPYPGGNHQYMKKDR